MKHYFRYKSFKLYSIIVLILVLLGLGIWLLIRSLLSPKPILVRLYLQSDILPTQDKYYLSALMPDPTINSINRDKILPGQYACKDGRPSTVTTLPTESETFEIIKINTSLRGPLKYNTEVYIKYKNKYLEGDVIANTTTTKSGYREGYNLCSTVTHDHHHGSVLFLENRSPTDGNIWILKNPDNEADNGEISTNNNKVFFQLKKQSLHINYHYVYVVLDQKAIAL